MNSNGRPLADSDKSFSFIISVSKIVGHYNKVGIVCLYCSTTSVLHRAGGALPFGAYTWTTDIIGYSQLVMATSIFRQTML